MSYSILRIQENGITSKISLTATVVNNRVVFSITTEGLVCKEDFLEMAAEMARLQSKGALL